MPTLRREAQSTSALEGTYAPLNEVLASDVVDEKDRSPAVREILNYVVAADLAFNRVEEGRNLTTGLLCELHSILVKGTTADNTDAGRIRQTQVVIGSRGGRIQDARFIPMPPGSALEASVTDLIDWIRPENHLDVNPIVAAAMAHYQFETIHPFNDGNGRIGRLLIVLQLIRDGQLTEPLLSVSPWFEARRTEYQDHLSHVSSTGSWDAWVRFFAEGVEASAIDTAQRIERLLSVQAHYQEIIRSSGTKGVIQHIADLLVGTPFVTITHLAEITGKTYQAVSNAVAKLVDLGILEEIEATRSSRTYVARQILRATI